MIPKIISTEIKITKKILKAIYRITTIIICSLYIDLRSKKGRDGILFSLLGVGLLYVLYPQIIAYTPKTPVVKAYTDQEAKIYFLKQDNYELKKENERLKNETGFLNKLTKGEKEIIVEYIKMKFKEKAKIALAVATCESNITADRIGDNHLTFMQNGTEYGRSYGIFQIRHLEGRPDPEWLLNAKNNVDYAYDLEEEQGFEPWTCYSGGYYTKYL